MPDGRLIAPGTRRGARFLYNPVARFGSFTSVAFASSSPIAPSLEPSSQRSRALSVSLCCQATAPAERENERREGRLSPCPPIIHSKARASLHTPCPTRKEKQRLDKQHNTTAARSPRVLLFLPRERAHTLFQRPDALYLEAPGLTRSFAARPPLL